MDNIPKIDALKDAVCALVSIAEDTVDDRKYFKELDDAGAAVIDILNEATEWIPVSSGVLPEMNKIYLDMLDIWVNVSAHVWATLENGEVIQANIEDGKWYTYAGEKCKSPVVAWKPSIKPAPYVKGDI